jgi:hypothetical protein
MLETKKRKAQSLPEMKVQGPAPSKDSASGTLDENIAEEGEENPLQ